MSRLTQAIFLVGLLLTLSATAQTTCSMGVYAAEGYSLQDGVILGQVAPYGYPSIGSNGHVAFIARTTSSSRSQVLCVAGIGGPRALAYACTNGSGCGDAAPGGGTYREFYRSSGSCNFPQINAIGDVLFMARLSGSPYSDGLYLYKASNSSITLVLHDGAPSPDGFTFQGIGSPCLSNAGAVAFMTNQSLRPNTPGIPYPTAPCIMRWASGSITIVASDGDPRPQGGQLRLSDCVSMNSSGLIACKADIVAGSNTPRPGILLTDGSTESWAVREQDAAPNGGTFSYFFPPLLLDSGKLAFAAYLQIPSSGSTVHSWIVGTPGAFRRAIAVGDAIDNGLCRGLYASIVGAQHANSQGDLIFACGWAPNATTATQERIAIARADGTLAVVARSLDASPLCSHLGSFGPWPQINEAGSVVFSASAGCNGHYSWQMPNVTIQTLDAADYIMPSSGFSVVPDQNVPRRAGRPRIGACADGSTELVIRWTSTSPGTLRASMPALSLDGRDGTIAAPGGPFVSAAQVSVTTSPVGQSGAHDALIVYRAPLDYLPPGSPGTISSMTRDVKVLLEFTPAASTCVFRSEITRQLRRPPVILAHGLWSSANDAWVGGAFTPLLAPNSRFDTYLFDYSDTSTAEFAFNAARAASHIRSVTDSVRQQGFGCSQVDWVGHSMGGLLPRTYYAYSVAGRIQAWRRTDNYGDGDLHKLILINSPQYGSPLANGLSSEPLRDVAPKFLRYGNAIRDLREGSAALRNLGVTPVPAWSLVGVGGRTFVNGATPTLQAVGRSLSGVPWIGPFGRLLAFAGTMAPSTFDVAFRSENHDLVVSQSSQTAGLAPIHVTLFPHLLGSLHTYATSDSAYYTEVVRLLGAPVSTFAPSLPPPTMPAPLRRVSGGAAPVLGLTVSNHPPLGTNPGVIDLVVSGINGFAPVEVDLFTPWSVETRTAPFHFAIALPSGVAGPVDFVALATDASGSVAYSSSLGLDLGGLGALQQLTARYPSFAPRAPLEQARMTVLGTYTSAIVRDLTVAVGTAFASSNTAVATVDNEGIVTAWEPGTAIITATHGGLTASSTVTVAYPPVIGYGEQVPGTADVPPTIGINADAARLGDAGFVINLGSVNGGAFGIVIAGWKPAWMELADLKLWVDLTDTLAFSATASHPAGGAGAGSVNLSIPIPADPVFLGVRVYWQGLFLDAGAPGGVSSTWGLVTTIQG